MTTAFCAPFFSTPKAVLEKPTMSVLRRIVDIANTAAKRTRLPPRTPRLVPNPPLFSDDELSDLTDAVARVKSGHLAVHRHDFVQTDTDPNDPISYISVASNQNITMAVFVMPPDSRIPLHDHTNMFVVSNVLWGKLEVHEYEPLPGECPSEAEKFLAQKQPTSILAEGSVRNLTPNRGNIHAFHAREWTAVFDVLLPPYDFDNGRPCHYFEPAILEQSNQSQDHSNGDHVILKKKVRSPEWYYTRNVSYKGIPVDS